MSQTGGTQASVRPFCCSHSYVSQRIPLQKLCLVSTPPTARSVLPVYVHAHSPVNVLEHIFLGTYVFASVGLGQRWGGLWFSRCCPHLTLTPAPDQQPLLWAASDLHPSLIYSPPLHRHILRFRAKSQAQCKDKLPPGWKHISPWKAQVPQRKGPS